MFNASAQPTFMVHVAMLGWFPLCLAIFSQLGVVRGVVVRSRSVFGTFGAGIQTLFGGNITIFTELAERTRQQAFDTMLVQADVAGADAVVGIRYDATEVMSGVTEGICYGTAVTVVPDES